MSKLPKHLEDFVAKYGLNQSDLWEVRAGAWAILHKALERVAAQVGITFEPPQIIEINSKDKLCAMVVTAHLKDRIEWATGEAAPTNNKNAYPVAMAEKRGKDRAALKLLQVHGDLYSESELDDIKETNGLKQLPKKDAKEVYDRLQKELNVLMTRESLKTWGASNRERIEILPDDWQDILRLKYEERLFDLKQKEALPTLAAG
jgi:hypothetical protein